MESDGARIVGRDALEGIVGAGGNGGPFDVVLCGTFSNIFSLGTVCDQPGCIRRRLTSDGQVTVVTWRGAEYRSAVRRRVLLTVELRRSEILRWALFWLDGERYLPDAPLSACD
ncbi:hypothetical protein [Corynebacterium sp.]|uniref:hypothetical protein n=1 Tax=Corynebacterium sp. TaxID=1720 RepID=UPI0028AD9B02|nr:hypothetical protein [Corynebacterium sp.]